MRRYVIHTDNSEPLQLDADWVQAEGNAIVLYAGLKPIAYFSLHRLISLEIVGEIRPPMPQEFEPEGLEQEAEDVEE